MNIDYSAITYDYYSDTLSRSVITEEQFNNCNLEVKASILKYEPYIKGLKIEDGDKIAFCLISELYAKAAKSDRDLKIKTSESFDGVSIGYDVSKSKTLTEKMYDILKSYLWLDFGV